MVDSKIDQTEAIEALYFAYRAFTAEPDRLLAKHDLGRAHHRILHFVARNPGGTVGELLKTLQISKQALSGPLRRLQDGAWLEQSIDSSDKRVRRLHLTASGSELEAALRAAQSVMLDCVFTEVGPARAAAWLDTMLALASRDGA